MLKGIPEIIGSDLLKALADMGHGDILVVADHFYPPYSKDNMEQSDMQDLLDPTRLKK